MAFKFLIKPSSIWHIHLILVPKYLHVFHSTPSFSWGLFIGFQSCAQLSQFKFCHKCIIHWYEANIINLCIHMTLDLMDFRFNKCHQISDKQTIQKVCCLKNVSAWWQRVVRVVNSSRQIKHFIVFICNKQYSVWKSIILLSLNIVKKCSIWNHVKIMVSGPRIPSNWIFQSNRQVDYPFSLLN